MRILVLTETDACCGPMAAAFLRDYSTAFEVVPAGRNPSQTIEPMVITAMHECLIDLEHYIPQDVRTLQLSDFDVVYECPDLLAPKTMDEFRRLRDFIKNEAYLFFRRMS
jgi:protein-tyrosine-phosphatase